MDVPRVLDYGIADVSAIYEGPGGALWELLMGELIHCEGEHSTRLLAERAGLRPGQLVLDVCSALGGPARLLATEFGVTVTGLDATPHMVNEANRRTAQAGLSDRVTFRHGNALDMPFKRESFDVVWGEDAWCYVTDKHRLLREVARVLRRGGTVAFTDWVQTAEISNEQMDALYGFMAFPYLETIPGYVRLLECVGMRVREAESLSEGFTACMRSYQAELEGRLRPIVVQEYGEELYEGVLNGVRIWRRAAEEGKVGRGRFLATKPE